MGIFSNSNINTQKRFNDEKDIEKDATEISKLINLKKNEQAIIVGYDKFLDTKTKRRLLELGFVKGKKVTLEQISILGDVLLVEINNYLLSLRTNIAKHILIKKITQKESI